MNNVLKLLKYLLLFIASVAVLTGAMVGATQVPFSKIKENIASSTEMLCNNAVLFSFMENGHPAFTVHFEVLM